MIRPALPKDVAVLERGWLSASTILLFDGDSATAIDSGYVTDAPETVRLVRDALQGRALARLINTHSHSDHLGGNAALIEAFGCAVTIPEGMAGMVSGWDEYALLLSAADQSAARFRHDATLAVGDSFEAGGTVWHAHAAPGHDMDALVFHSPDVRVLISGDALWRDGFGILFPEVIGEGGGIEAARETLEAIGRLSVDLVIPGHGAPFVEVGEALESAFGRLRAFEEDGARMARNALRACITFTLLERGRMSIETLPHYLDTVPLYREANSRFLRLAPDVLADWLVGSLVAAGVARREGAELVAA